MTKLRKLIFIPVLCIIICIIFFLISQPQKAESISVIYIPKIQDSSNDFWTTLMQGAQMAASEYNINLTIYAPDNESDYEKQNELLLKAAKEKPDVIALSPISNTESNETLEKIKSLYKIPIVLIDSTISSNIQTASVSSDNVEGGKQMGYYALNLIDDSTKIAIVSHVPGASTSIEREKGFRKALGKHQNQIVDVVYSYSDFTTAYNETKALLQRRPDITLIAGLNEYSAVGAGRAIKDLGLTNKVKIIGFDNSIAAVNLLEENVFCAIVIQKPFNMGYLGIETAYKIAKGLKYDTYIDSGCELITLDDMYTDTGQKSLFSFLEQ